MWAFLRPEQHKHGIRKQEKEQSLIERIAFEVALDPALVGSVAKAAIALFQSRAASQRTALASGKRLEGEEDAKGEGADAEELIAELVEAADLGERLILFPEVAHQRLCPKDEA